MRRQERGQLMLGGGLALLLAAAISCVLLRQAYDAVRASEDRGRTRDVLLEEGARLAGHLNDLSYNQALVLWHLAGVVRAWKEFAEGALMASVARPFGERWTTPRAFPKDASLAAYRNASSLRSSRHLAEAARLLERNGNTLRTIEVLAPGFQSTIRRLPVEDVLCRVGERWGEGRALRLFLLEPVIALLAGGNLFRWNSRECGFALAIGFGSRGVSPLASTGHARIGLGPTLVRFDLAWRAFAHARDPGGDHLTGTAFVLPQPDARRDWETLLVRSALAPTSRARLKIGVEHPAGDGPAAFLVPRWAPIPGPTRKEHP